jgi:Holliday junction resolvase-like predicted endonuclease
MASIHPSPEHRPLDTHTAFLGHLRNDGLWVAFAFLWRTLAARLLPAPRDAGERAAERFLRALGYRVLARNWRSPRDARDEADLVVLSPDRREVVIVEVKRAAGPWDALRRVDSRKKEVLWRLLTDMEGIGRYERHERERGHERHEREGGHERHERHERHVRHEPRTLRNAVARAEFVRVDLVGVRGVGRTASVVDHDCGLFLRALRARTGDSSASRPP